MTLDAAIEEWGSKRRRMGCVAATEWLCARIPEFYPERLRKFTQSGEVYEHVVATNGKIRIDLAPYADCPSE
jgi:hypothetical protein